MPSSAPTGAPPSDVYARALAWLQAKGLSQAEAEALLAVFSPCEEGVGETEAVFRSVTARSSRRTP